MQECRQCGAKTLKIFCPACLKQRDGKAKRCEEPVVKRRRFYLAHHAYDGFWDNAVRALEEDR